MIQASRVGRIKGPNCPLFSLDSGTQRNAPDIPIELIFYNLKSPVLDIKGSISATIAAYDLAEPLVSEVAKDGYVHRHPTTPYR